MRKSKRDAVLEAAERVFTRFTYPKTSVDDVAREARAGKATVYAHFPSKEALYLSVIEREVDLWFSTLAARTDWTLPAPALLESLALAGVEYLEGKPLLQELYGGKNLEVIGGWRERWHDLRERTLQVIRKVL